MSLELISFKICPFVQRAVITLLYKKMPFEVTHIDLMNPPAWFQDISPFGKVPVLKVDDASVIFDSAIIDEYLDEICQGNLLPKQPLQRAIDRSIINFGSDLILDFSAMIHAQDEESYDKNFAKVKKELNWLEQNFGEGPNFNGNEFSLVDIAFAPLFMRMDILNLGDTFYSKADMPKVSAWASGLLQLPELKPSVVDDFEELFKTHIKKKAAYAAQRMGLV